MVTGAQHPTKSCKCELLVKCPKHNHMSAQGSVGIARLPVVSPLFWTPYHNWFSKKKPTCNGYLYNIQNFYLSTQLISRHYYCLNDAKFNERNAIKQFYVIQFTSEENNFYDATLSLKLYKTLSVSKVLLFINSTTRHLVTHATLNMVYDFYFKKRELAIPIIIVKFLITKNQILILSSRSFFFQD